MKDDEIEIPVQINGKTKCTIAINPDGDKDEILAKAKEALGNKAVKELNVYYQPETGMVYYTADGESGSYSL